MNKKQQMAHKLLAILFFLAVAGSVLCLKQVTLASWVEEPDGMRYEQEDGEYAVGFTDIDGQRYYFDEDGYLVKGKFHVTEGDTESYYYADKNGVIQVGVIRTKKVLYITDENGKILTGFVEIEGNKYYFDEKAKLVTGWFKIDENWFYGDEDGIIATGFLTLDGYRYYLNPDGSRVSDTIMVIEGITYVFNKDGSIDENATLLYPVQEYLNAVRMENGKEPFVMNTKVQACAMFRAAGLVEGYRMTEDSMGPLENLLANRGVLCDGGYEFSYGGIADYGIDRLIEAMKRDVNLQQVLKEDLSEAGLGVCEQDGVYYYDVILIRTERRLSWQDQQ